MSLVISKRGDSRLVTDFGDSSEFDFDALLKTPESEADANGHLDWFFDECEDAEDLADPWDFISSTSLSSLVSSSSLPGSHKARTNSGMEKKVWIAVYICFSRLIVISITLCIPKW